MVEKFIKKSTKKIHFYNQMEFRKRSNIRGYLLWQNNRTGAVSDQDGKPILHLLCVYHE